MGAPQSVKSCAANCQKSMSNIETRAHWENLYQTKGEHEVSWFQESPTISLELIRATGVNTMHQSRRVDHLRAVAWRLKSLATP